MGSNLANAGQPRNYQFNYFHPFCATWCVGYDLWNSLERESWSPAVTLNGEFIFIDWVVLQFDELTSLDDVRFALRDHAFIITTGGLLCMPLSDTIYQLNQYRKIAERLASDFGAEVVDVFTPIKAQLVFAFANGGLEVGVL